MSARNGSLMVVKIGNGGSPEIFSMISGVASAQIVINNPSVAQSNVAGDGWDKLAASAGLQSAAVDILGIFTNSSSERYLRQCAIKRLARNYHFIFDRGDSIRGAFVITRYTQQSNVESKEEYQVSLRSTGAISYAEAGT
jgi:predicted secreted protein